MTANNCILETPPRFCQKIIYQSEEAEMACWAASAEMIAKWKRSNAFFIRPVFADKLPQSASDLRVRSIIASTKSNQQPLTNDQADNIAFLTKVAYMDFIRDWLQAWGFRFHNSPPQFSWTSQQIVELLQTKGPLLCSGTFFPGGSRFQIGGRVHAIAVYGYAQDFGGIYYIDPWDGVEKKMSLDEFNSKIEKINKDAICSRVPNWKNPQSDYLP